ncbi:DedA family protein [Paenibacillus sp. PR3]|uniref:DedA family protein n=1 Tax=Paenibacillus terricola TaxID=2763503 RepID=A0ABR8MV74_9BACL|nr:DedA family protein [Paenibacillus terricola]MBD3919171.1 DedA family protein [Paenibacillus terricola]
MEILTNLLAHDGYWIISLFLLLEMLALPLPGEMMMGCIGLLVYEQQLNWFYSIAAASLGVVIGVTLSYWIGYRLGRPFIIRHGQRFHLTEARMNTMAQWFDKYGDKLLFVAYFIPGVRHMTGYFCGVTRMPFRRYAIFAYSGAIFWASLFISLGKFLGPQWEHYHSSVNHWLIILGIASALTATVIYVYRIYKRKAVEAIDRLLKHSRNHMQSLDKVKNTLEDYIAFVIICTPLVIGLMQELVDRTIFSIRGLCLPRS